MALQEIGLKEEYRSDRDDIISEFFVPCLSSCVEYNRCVDILSIHTLTTIAMTFENFTEGRTRLRMITGHRFRSSDLDILASLFSEKRLSLEGKMIKNEKIARLQRLVSSGQIELKVAIPNSDHIVGSFSERIGIFKDGNGDAVAFTGTSRESFSVHTRNFESVDVFTSWADRTRIERKVKNFERLWENKTKHVEVYSFPDAEKDHLLKYTSEWVMGD